MRKYLILLLSLLIANPVYAAQLVTVSELKGLQRQTKADKIEVGSHAEFDNAFIDEANIKVVKGRDRLNSSAALDTTVNMLCYYENKAGTTQKYLVKEADEIVSYDTDWTNRTQVVGSLTNEPADCVQQGDNIYFTSSTDGLYVWTGSGSATAVGSVSAPSSVDFTVDSSATGGMTSGTDIILSADLAVDSQCNTVCDGVTAADSACVYINSEDMEGDGVTSDTGTLETAGVASTYSYKVTKSNSKWGFESETSSADTVSLSGDDTFTWSATGCVPCDFDHTDATCDNNCCTGITASTTGRETATTGTSAAAPADPFDQYCYYRTTANGEDYFKVFCSKTFSGTLNDGKPDLSLGDELDTTIDTISPPSYRYIESYLGLLFVAEDQTIRRSHLPVDLVTDANKYWLETDNDTIASKSEITGLQSTRRSLLVFTNNDIYEYTGVGFDNLRFRPVINGLGAVNDEVIEVDTEGDVYLFAGVQGAYKIRTSETRADELVGSLADQSDSSIVRISSPAMDSIFAGDDSYIDLDPTDYASAHAYYDRTNDLYFLNIDEHIFIYNAVNETWSHVPASKFSASVYAQSPGQAGQGLLVDDLGFAWNNWTGYESSTESGTVTGNPTSSTSTTLTDTGASFDITGDDLKGVWVTVDCSDTLQHRRIASNTATILTVDTAWTSNPTTSCSYYIGYLTFDILTKQYNLSNPPKKIGVQDMRIMHELSDSAQAFTAYIYLDKSTTATDTDTEDFTDDYEDVLGLSGTAYWAQFRLRSFVYNTSDTINPPVNIINYSFRAFEEDES